MLIKVKNGGMLLEGEVEVKNLSRRFSRRRG